MGRYLFSLVLLLTTLLTESPKAYATETTAETVPHFENSHADDVADHQLSRQFLRQLRSTTPLRYDPILINYLENLSYRLAFHSAVNMPDLQLILIPDRRINAFAVAGGVIGVNEGLLLYAENESELAAVLAHELGHISQRHYARSQENSSKSTALYLGALLASIAIASVNTDAGFALGMSAQAALAQDQLAHSRQHEREADRVGMKTLVSAGFNPKAVPIFFSKMEKQARYVGLMPDFLLTHPITQERIADSTLRARQYTEKGSDNSLEYQLIRVRLLAIMNQKDGQQISALRQQLDDNPESQPARLSLTFALLDKGDYEAARTEITQLLAKYPQRIDYIIASADIDIADNKPAQALKTLQEALLLNPDNVSLGLYAARAATLNQQGKLSLMWLEPLSHTRPEDPIVWQALIEAYQQLKDGLGILRARAEYAFLLGQGEKALKDLEQASVLAKTNYPLLAKIEQRRADIQKIMAIEKN